MDFWVTIAGDIGKSSLELWQLIEKYNVNLTQLTDVTFVHGKVSEQSLMEIVYACARLGKPIQLNRD